MREGFVRLIADAVGTVFRGYAVRLGKGCSHSLIGVGDTLFLWDPSSCRLGDG